MSINIKNAKVTVTPSFYKVDTDDGVAETIILKKRHDSIIDISDTSNALVINDLAELNEVIKLLEESKKGFECKK